jgi:hypothetical protein
MKINFLDYDTNEFLIKDGIFCGIPSKLIQPNHVGVKFTQKNKIFRSSIWSTDGCLLSGGFYKFVNFLENPENFPVPSSLNGCKIVDKIDGSLAIIDYINNTLSCRTRGTFSYVTMRNASDFDYCLNKYPSIQNWIQSHSNYSLLLEITTPSLKIVLDYGNDPDFWLVGAVNKDNYELMTQANLNDLSHIVGIKRPSYYTFTSMDNLLESIRIMKGKEGCCLYSKADQEIHKIKAEQYLKLHRFKENATLENTLELFVEYGCPSYEEFENKLQSQFDYECWSMIRGFASNVCDAKKEIDKIINHMIEFVEPLKIIPRKDAAKKIIDSYGISNRQSFCFQILDGKILGSDAIKKLLWQILKN